MVDNYAVQIALRARMLTLSVVSTGSISLSATATGYARATGSFLADGFFPGMEATPSGFSSNPVDVITNVDALNITTKNTRGAEVAAGGRTLSVGLPLNRGWENKKPVTDPPTQGVPYVLEQYIPGPTAQVTLGALGEIEMRPMYTLQVFVPSESGIEAASKYADSIIRLFAPRTAIAVGSDVLRVRTDVGPFRGQLLQREPSFAAVSITIPLFLRTPNSI